MNYELRITNYGAPVPGRSAVRGKQGIRGVKRQKGTKVFWYTYGAMRSEAKLWLDYAWDDLKSMKVMWEAHRYGPTAFYCQQVVEKMLKALITERGHEAPRKSHDLVRLLEDSKLKDFPKQWLVELKEMSRHYFMVRYPDLGKKIYSKRENVAKIVIATKEVYTWLRKELEK